MKADGQILVTSTCLLPLRKRLNSMQELYRNEENTIMEKFAAAIAFTLSLLVTSALTLGSYMAIYMFRHYVPVRDNR